MDEDGDVARSLPHDLQTPAEADPYEHPSSDMVVFPDENVADSVDSSHGGEKAGSNDKTFAEKKREEEEKEDEESKKRRVYHGCDFGEEIELKFDFYV